MEIQSEYPNGVMLTFSVITRKNIQPRAPQNTPC